MGIAPDRAPGFGRRSARADASGGGDQQRGQPRRRQVDQIVKPRGGPAESRVARRAVADHAVGGVDRLVDRGAGQTRDGHPEGRRDDAIGEIFRQALDRRPRHARLVKSGGIAADDMGYCFAAGDDAAPFESGGDARDMLIKTSLREQRAGKDSRDEKSKWQQD